LGLSSKESAFRGERVQFGSGDGCDRFVYYRRTCARNVYIDKIRHIRHPHCTPAPWHTHPFRLHAQARLKWATSGAAVTPQREMLSRLFWGARRHRCQAILALLGASRGRGASSVGELRETVCTPVGLEWENLGRLSVARPTSFRSSRPPQRDGPQSRQMTYKQFARFGCGCLEAEMSVESWRPWAYVRRDRARVRPQRREPPH
jgi:hypothetical protein